MRRRAVAVAVCGAICALSPAARAETETRLLVSVPLTIGLLSASRDHDLSIGLRPEVIVGRIDDASDDGWGLGLYGGLTGVVTDLERSQLGGGLTVVAYNPGGAEVDWVPGLAVAVSAGAARARGGPTLPEVGMFVGLRFASLSPVDLPMGLRFDVRPGLGGAPREFAVQLQVDVIAATALVVILMDVYGRKR